LVLSSYYSLANHGEISDFLPIPSAENLLQTTPEQ
jgi:hypothetical protein